MSNYIFSIRTNLLFDKGTLFSLFYYFKFAFVVLLSIITKQMDEIKRLLATNNSLVNGFMYGYLKRTLLHKAAEIGDRRVCELLVDHGADINKQDARNQTPLWVAAEEGHLEICRVLIRNGTSVNQKDSTQRTPIWIAARKKHEDVCKILIDNGACLFKEDELGTDAKTALDDPLMFERLRRWHVKYGKMLFLMLLLD